MRNQRNAMWTWDTDGLGKCREHSFYDIQFAEHRGRKQVDARAMLQKEFSDIPSSHVGGGAQTGFKVTATPVPCGVDKPWFLRQQFLDAIQIAMSVSYKFLN